LGFTKENSLLNSAGTVQFGSRSGAYSLNAEPEPCVRFREVQNIEPVRGVQVQCVRFGVQQCSSAEHAVLDKGEIDPIDRCKKACSMKSLAVLHHIRVAVTCRCHWKSNQNRLAYRQPTTTSKAFYASCASITAILDHFQRPRVSGYHANSPSTP
jgi:hypothetical protein